MKNNKPLKNPTGMRIIKYNSFEDAFAAAFEFMKQGIRCKSIGLKTLQVWTDGSKRPFYDFV